VEGEPCAGGWAGVACEGGAVTTVELGYYLADESQNTDETATLTGDLAELTGLVCPA
jgi:hypothetical protein